MNHVVAEHELEKKALLERLVRLGATDVPKTPRLMMRKRSPQELAALQHGVTAAFGKIEAPVKRVVHGALDKLPQGRVQKVLKGGADLLIENPETIPMQAVPIPGLTPAWLAGKKGLERGLDYLAPVHADNVVPLRPMQVPGMLQKAAFKLQGHTRHQGLEIAIENRKGSVRKGVDKDGTPWRTEMKLPYGYIQGSKGADGEEVDAYVGPKKDATHAYVVHQKKDDGSYDEDKVMLGQPSEAAARKAYLAHYNTDKFLGPIKAVPMDRFKELLDSKKKLVKISGVIQAAFLEELTNIRVAWSAP